MKVDSRLRDDYDEDLPARVPLLACSSNHTWLDIIREGNEPGRDQIGYDANHSKGGVHA